MRLVFTGQLLDGRLDSHGVVQMELLDRPVVRGGFGALHHAVRLTLEVVMGFIAAAMAAAGLAGRGGRHRLCSSAEGSSGGCGGCSGGREWVRLVFTGQLLNGRLHPDGVMQVQLLDGTVVQRGLGALGLRKMGQRQFREGRLGETRERDLKGPEACALNRMD